MKHDQRKEPKSQVAWGYYNWGRLWGIAYTRKAAVKKVEEILGKPWSEAKNSCEIHKVRVEKYSP